jgi:hypothetical protein
LNQTPQNSITVTKDDSDIQSWQVVAKYKGKTSDRYTVSISKSENCGLSGCPVTIINNQNNTVCTGTQYTLDASLNCSGFSGENRIGTRWEYKHGKNAEWSTLDTDILTVEPNMHSTYVIDNVAEIDDGDYRLTVYTLGSPSTSVVSNTVTLSVIKSYKAPDFRAMIDPSSSPAKVYLSTFIDVANVESVKWSGVGNFINLINDETGEFDAQNLQPGRVYTYRYTAMSECGPSTAKAYVLSSTAKLPVKNNREIYICKDLESSKYVNLNQILGMDHRGTWKYIDDEYSIVPFFISESTEKYGFSTIFNALGAYEEVYAMTDDGTYPSKYDHPENPKKKMFKFQYTSVDGTVVDFTITVGE